MGRIKSKSKKSKSRGLVSTATSIAKGYLSGKKGGGGGRRRRGPAYWANKVLVEKLKRRYNRLKYGGVR